MLDPDLLALKTHQSELWQEAATHALVRRLTVAKPPWRERWLRYLKRFFTAHGLWGPGLPALRVEPAVVYRAKHRHGGRNSW